MYVRTHVRSFVCTCVRSFVKPFVSSTVCQFILFCSSGEIHKINIIDENYDDGDDDNNGDDNNGHGHGDGDGDENDLCDPQYHYNMIFVSNVC